MQRMHFGKRLALLPTLTILTLVISGCTSQSPETTSDGDGHGHSHADGHSHHDHDHHGRPDSLHDAVAQLEAIEQAISGAIATGDANAAHVPLHEVAALLESLPDVAAETDLPKEEWEAVKAASERMKRAYDEIDGAFHAKDGEPQAAYKQVADELSAALGEIRTRLPLAGEQADADHDHEGHDHDHDDHDHDDHDHDDHDHDGHDHESVSNDGGADA